MIAHWVCESKYTVVFTGAGMSTESGVPDFRSSTGLWHGKDPQTLASTVAMNLHRKEFVDFYHMRMKALETVRPHHGYEVLELLTEQNLIKSIITQNTDGLHEEAGHRNVIPLHGSIRKLHCDACGTNYSTDYYFKNKLYCTCGGFIRPSVLLFGEPLDSDISTKAVLEAQRSDLFIVLGSSLVVSPANSLPVIAKENGAKLVIVNQEPTHLDHVADMVIHDRKVGDVLQEVKDQLYKMTWGQD